VGSNPTPGTDFGVSRPAVHKRPSDTVRGAGSHDFLASHRCPRLLACCCHGSHPTSRRWLAREARRGVYLLTIVNDRRYTVLNAHLMDLVRAVKPGSRPHQRNRPGCVNICASWKHWPCLFPQHGRGLKHRRQIVLEPWQRDIVERHPGDFARGLFHSDGCRTMNWTTRTIAGRVKRYEYPRYFFSNESTDILAICGWTLDLLGVQWRLPRANAICVARAASVAILDEHVGPKKRPGGEARAKERCSARRRRTALGCIELQVESIATDVGHRESARSSRDCQDHGAHHLALSAVDASG
jgi:hypothetical protein